VVWALASDINTPAEYSTEFLGADWDSDERGVGALFHGRNQHPAIGEWTMPCYVDAYEPNRAFGWRTADPDSPGARWAFELEPKEAGTRLRFTYSMGPGSSGTSMAVEQRPDKEQTIIRRRIEVVRENMQHHRGHQGGRRVSLSGQDLASRRSVRRRGRTVRGFASLCSARLPPRSRRPR
jgi:hypothetical protein